MNLKDYDIVKKLKGGNQAKSYLLKDNTVLKIFNNPLHISEIERYKYFLKNANDSFVFPFKFICDDNMLYGYIYKYAPGLTLEKCFENSNLTGLSNNSKLLEKDIDLLSDAEITLYDFHDENIIYDGKMYRVIDPDEYGLYIFKSSTDINDKEIYSTRLFVQSKNRTIHRIVICNLFISSLKQNPYTKLMLEKVNKYKKTTMFPSQIISEVKEQLDKTFIDDIKTLKELKKYR